jgi:DNA-binding MarR family transcriptional regulator
MAAPRTAPLTTTHAAAKAAPLDREGVVTALASLSLPLMWTLRQRAMQVYEPFGVRPTRVLLMELVARGIDQPKLIAEVLDAVPPAVTAMVNELMEKGWLARESDASDRRRVRLRLTAAGEAALERLRAAWQAASRADLERIELDDLRVVLRVFERLTGGAA